MYLSQLNDEKKALFLELSIHGALANGDFAVSEKEMINAYCQEMGLETVCYEVTKDLDTVLSMLKKGCSQNELHMILVEITALIMGDGEYDPLEKDFMKHVQQRFEVTTEKMESVTVAITQLLLAYELLNKVIED